MPVVVAADGTFQFGPMGWEVNKLAAGVYEIVHRIGPYEYVPICGAISGSDYKLHASIQEMTPERVVVQTNNVTQLQDNAFVLLVIGI